MRIVSRLTGGIAVAALLVTATSPAAARDWRWGGPQRHHHHDRGPSTGAVVGAIAAVGILAAIASTASKKKEAEQRRAEDAPPYDDRAETYRDEGGARYDEPRGDGQRYDDVRVDRGGQDAAVDGCVLAARSQASRGGDYAEIRGVNGVNARGGGWDVSGRVEQRSSYSATDGWQRNFRCSWQDGRVASVSLD